MITERQKNKTIFASHSLHAAGRAAALGLSSVLLMTACPLTARADEDVAYEQRVLFYDYAAYTLLPTYGYASHENSSRTITGAEAWRTDNPTRCWDTRTGLVSALCLDMNQDGIPEMLVTRMAKDSSEAEDPAPNAMYATVYTVDDSWSKVIEKDTRELFTDNNASFTHATGSVLTLNGREYLVVEQIRNSYFGDNASAVYDFYSYDGSKLRKYFTVGKTDGGSSGIAYKLVTWNRDGSSDRTLLWADPDYLGENGGRPVNDEDIGGAIESGFAMLDLDPAARVEYENADWTLFGDEADAFLTYYETEDVKSVFLYDASGAGDSTTRDMVIQLNDSTALAGHIAKRGIDVNQYLNGAVPEATPDSAADRTMSDSDFIFPDSADRRLTKDDIAGKSWDELRRGINEIYARDGYSFHTPEIRSFFEQFGWYEALFSDQNEVYDNMTETEQRNVDFLNQYVKARDSGSSADLPEDYDDDISEADVVG